MLCWLMLDELRLCLYLRRGKFATGKWIVSRVEDVEVDKEEDGECERGAGSDCEGDQ